MLLNDSAIQVGEGNLEKLMKTKITDDGQDIPIIIESLTKNHLIRKQVANENNLMKIRSNENINYDKYNEHMDQIALQRRYNNHQSCEKNMRAGSLSNLTSSTSSITGNSSSSANYFSKKIDDFNHEFYEYLSTPFYGYQRKDLDKIDFSNGKTALT